MAAALPRHHSGYIIPTAPGSGKDTELILMIDVEEDLGALAKGTDLQLERAITEIKNMIKEKGYNAPKPPAYEKR
jgi:tricorn protease